MKKTYTLAIDARHLALIKRDKNQYLIEHLRTFEPHVKPLDILKPIIHRKSPQIVSGLPAKEVILRRIHLKLKGRKEILEALPFQLEANLPFPVEDLLVIPTLHLGKDGSDIDLLATTTKKFEHHLQPLKEKGVDPDVISAEPLALFRFAQHLFPQHASLLVYHEKNQTLVVMKDRSLVAFQPVREGDLDRALAYFQKKYPEIEQILHIGSTPLNAPIQILKVENEDWIPYAIAIGLALDAIKDDEQSRQFRAGNLRAAHHVKKVMKKKVSFFIASVLFSATIFTLGHLYLKSEKEAFLTSLQFPKELSLIDVAKDLGAATRKQDKNVLAQSTVPAVHEVLAWLSSHPKFAEDVSITHFDYQLTKCPRLGSKSKTFAAKVDLEFTTALPRVARSFHESLISDRAFVDQKQEIKFSADHGLYSLSFFLKARSS